MTPRRAELPGDAYTAPARDDAHIRAFRDEVLDCTTQNEGKAGGRAIARRVHGQEDAHGRVSAGGRAARRPHSGREECAVGAGRESPTAPSRSADELRAIYEKEKGLKSSDDVIAYCRIGERLAHLVRAHLPARLRQGAELRRQLDRVGQRGPTSDRAMKKIDAGARGGAHVHQHRGAASRAHHLERGPGIRVGETRRAADPAGFARQDGCRADGGADWAPLAACSATDVVEILAKRRTPADSLVIESLGNGWRRRRASSSTC